MVTQLSKNHHEHLILASEMLHIAVIIILVNIVIELSSIQKKRSVEKNVFILAYCSHLFLSAKLQNQAHSISKKSYNQLYINSFSKKIYFNWTAVLYYNKFLNNK